MYFVFISSGEKLRFFIVFVICWRYRLAIASLISESIAINFREI